MKMKRQSQAFVKSGGSEAGIRNTNEGERVLLLPVGLAAMVFSVAAAIFAAMIGLFLYQKGEYEHFRDKVIQLGESQAALQERAQGIRDLLANDQKSLEGIGRVIQGLNQRMQRIEDHNSASASSPSSTARESGTR